MKHLTKLLSLMLVLSLLLSLSPKVFAEGSKRVTYDGITYEIYADHAEVVKGVYDGTLETLTLPETVEGVPLTAIQEYAFQDWGMVYLNLPDTITFLDYWCFDDCKELRYVRMSEGIVEICPEAFGGCTNLHIFYLPPSFQRCWEDVIWQNGEIGGSGITILCHEGSFAQTYAQERGLPYVIKEEQGDYFLTDTAIYYTADGLTATLMKIGLHDESAPLIIADEINGIPVTGVANNCIYGPVVFRYLILGENITKLQAGAFGNELIENIYIPRSVTEISMEAFSSNYASHLNIIAYEDSYAHQFAESHGYKYELIPNMHFTDVNPGSWYYDSVKYVFENGLMQGTSSTRFDPHGTMTRAMLAQVLFNLAGDKSFNLPSPFTDVPANAWYAQAVSWAAWCELVNGVTSTEFKPNDPVTREQMVTIFYRFANALQLDTSGRADLSGYEDDQKISGYATDAFSWAVEAGIINGVTDTKLDPKGMSNRAQVATVIARFMQWLSVQ